MPICRVPLVHNQLVQATRNCELTLTVTLCLAMFDTYTRITAMYHLAYKGDRTNWPLRRAVLTSAPAVSLHRTLRSAHLPDVSLS
jgi:hypothetical protein